MRRVEILGAVKGAIAKLCAACEDEHVNHDPHIGKAINILQRLRDRLEGRAL